MKIFFLLIALASGLSAGPVQTPETSIALFRETVRTTLDEALQANDRYIALKPEFAKELRAYPSSSGELMRLVDSTLAPIQKSKLILSGETRDLDPDRPVWIVVGPGGMKRDFQACIEKETGKLLLLWLVPEG